MIGRTISHYAILERLGEGGMGVVYKAEDIKLKRTVALKFLKSEILASEEERARFRREAQAAAALEHPNICTIYEIDESEGQAFIAMAYCAGRSLKARILGKPLNVPETLNIAVQTAEGLEEAHAKGIIHRDIKSSNIMITARGQVKIMDFGIAKLFEKSESTRTGSVLGTIAYMSPEQARGEAAEFQTDIWSLGTVIFEMLTGELPFKGETEAAVFHSLIYEAPRSLEGLCPECPKKLIEIVTRCLEKDPGSRYRAIRELKDDLKGLEKCYEGTITFTPEPAAAKSTKPKRAFSKRRAVLIGLAGLAAAVALIFLKPFSGRGWRNRLGLVKLPEEKHLLVLPFKNVGGNPARQFLCDGLVEVLTSRLTQLVKYHGGLWVFPASEVLELNISSALEARKFFGATLVLTGSVQSQKENVLLTLNLIDARTLRQLHSEVFMDRPDNIRTFQEGIVLKAAEMLEIDLPGEARRELVEGGTTVPGAYSYYLQGLSYLDRYEKEENVDAAIGVFKRALDVDPDYGLAYAGLGRAFWRKYELVKDRTFVTFAQDACRRASRIDMNLEAVHITLGIIYSGTGRKEEASKEFETVLRRNPMSYEATLGYARALEDGGRLQEAESVFLKAINLNPRIWSGYNQLGVFYYGNNRLSEAEKMFRLVIDLTPDNYRGYNNLMGIYYLLKKDDRVREMFEKSISLKPSADAYSNFGTIQFFRGRYEEALKSFEEAIRLGRNVCEIWGNLADCYRYTPGYEMKATAAYRQAVLMAEKEARINPEDALLRARLAFYYAMSGETGKALSEVREARKISPESVLVLKKCVQVFENIDKRDDAFEILAQYFRLGGSAEEIENDPDLAGLRKDLRYKEIIKAAGEGAA